MRAGRESSSFGLLAVLYFASGAVALLDEVIFSKYLEYAFGASAYASSAVLVSFMGGLALGAAAMARFDGRIGRPLFAYGVLEIAVGVAASLSPWMLSWVTSAYVSFATRVPASLATISLVRGMCASAVVLAPTTAMGATLPLVARAAGDGSAASSGRVELLYGANTAGGALGSLLGAYVVVPCCGLAASLRGAACLSAAVGLGAMAIARRAPASPREPLIDRRGPGGLPAGVAFAAAASGVLVFASEVLFVHLMALVDGTTVYAFGLVLAVFLVALSLGATASRVLSRRTAETALAMGLAVSGLALAVVVPTWDRLPALFVAAGPFVVSWAGREAVRAAVAALAIGVPATCMGMTFPLAIAAVAARADRGALIGRLAAYNTLGAIGGSIVSGFVLLPALGSQRSFWVVALSYVAAALAVRFPPRRTTLAAAAIAAVWVAASPRWDLARLASGSNIYFQRQPEQGAVVFVAEDVHGGVVTVTRASAGTAPIPDRVGDTEARTTLWTNGKYQGDDGPQMQAQRGFADVPAMFVRTFGNALVVGLGTGTTLGELARYPFERIDVAELSPAIVDAARTFFARANGRVLEDPRVSVDLQDGRNLLLIRERSYELVTIELTSIWFAGATNLYSRESYEIAARRLADGGVLSQWIQLHHTTLREIASQIATGRTVFEHAAFFIRGEQGMLVMSRSPLRARPRAPEDLDDLLFADDSLDAFVDDVCTQYRTTRRTIVTTDDDRRLEYETPRNNVPGLPSIAETSALLRKWRRADVIATIAGK